MWVLQAADLEQVEEVQEVTRQEAQASPLLPASPTQTSPPQLEDDTADENPISAGHEPHGNFVERSVPAMTYRAFYDTFLARYLSCYACEPADRAMALLDMDHSGSISWTELRLRACWALAQAGSSLTTLEQLIDVVFHVFLLPDMRAGMALSTTHRRLKGVMNRVAFTSKPEANMKQCGKRASTPDTALSTSTECVESEASPCPMDTTGSPVALA